MAKSQKELEELEAMFADPQRAPIEHVSGPRMGRELLNRLQVSTVSGSNTKLQAQIELISAAIRLGDALVEDGSLKSW